MPTAPTLTPRGSDTVNGNALTRNNLSSCSALANRLPLEMTKDRVREFLDVGLGVRSIAARHLDLP